DAGAPAHETRVLRSLLHEVLAELKATPQTPAAEGTRLRLRSHAVRIVDSLTRARRATRGVPVNGRLGLVLDHIQELRARVREGARGGPAPAGLPLRQPGREAERPERALFLAGPLASVLPGVSAGGPPPALGARC